ncbi:MAG: VanZ family protein [Eubacteriales bacterium]|nr:VanZ family protein [Eubacteriales bacterium]
MKYFWLTVKKMVRYLLKPLSFVPALCMIYVIFSFSAQSGAESGQLSLTVAQKLVRAAGELLDKELDPAQIAHYAELIHFYVRKLAHFTEYFLLGMSVALPLYVYRLRGFWLVLAAGFFCAAFAGLDEYHQSFVAGRTPSLRDVAIDTAGSLTGIYFTRVFGFIGRKTVFAPLSLERRRKVQHRPRG